MFMGFIEGVLTSVGIVAIYLLFHDMLCTIIAGIIFVAFFMKGDND